MANEGKIDVLKWTLSQAAQQCEVSRSTMRRYREQGKFPNAEKRGDGWVIPVNDLISAGLTPGKPKPGEDVLTEQAQPRNGEQAQAENGFHEELVELRAMLKVEQAHRQAAERIAAEREQALKDMRQAMRMIEAAPARTITHDPTPKDGPVAPVEIQLPVTENPKPKKWFSRILGNS